MEANDIKNLVFVIIAIGAWVVQAAIKRKQAGEEHSEAKVSRRARASEAPDQIEEMGDEPDVVFGRRRLPARYAEQVRPKPPPVPQTAQRRASAQPPSPPPPTAGGTREALRSGGQIHLGRLENRKLEGSLKSTEAAFVRRSQSGANARRRLGIQALGSRRRAVRTALLWGEVLGPPLALRGPHAWKPPTAR